MGKILGLDGRPALPQNGRTPLGPFADSNELLKDFGLPHVLTFGALLNSSYRTYYQSGYDEALKKDRQFAQLMRNDCYLMGLMQERTLSVVSMPWHLEVPDEKDEKQKFVRDHLTTTLRNGPRFREMLYNLEHEGTWYGRCGVQIKPKWTVQDGLKTLAIQKWMPVQGDKIDHMWDGTPTINVYGAAELPDAEYVYTDRFKSIILKGTWRERFLIHRHHQWDTDFLDGIFAAEAVHGSGIRSAVFWWQWVRCEWLGKVSDYFDRVGTGVNLWYYELGNAASEAAVRQAAKDQSGKVNLVLPRSNVNKGQGFERVETPISGAEAMGSIASAIEEWLKYYIVGQTLSSDHKGSGGLGGSGAAEFQEGTKGLISAHDANNLGETLTGSEEEFGLVHYLQKHTFPDTAPDQPNGFTVRFVFDADKGENKERLDNIKVVVDSGVPVRADDLRAAAGLSKPNEDDELVPGPAEGEAGIGEDGEPDPNAPPGAKAPAKSSGFGKDKEPGPPRRNPPAGKDRPSRFGMKGRRSVWMGPERYGMSGKSLPQHPDPDPDLKKAVNEQKTRQLGYHPRDVDGMKGDLAQMDRQGIAQRRGLLKDAKGIMALYSVTPERLAALQGGRRDPSVVKALEVAARRLAKKYPDAFEGFSPHDDEMDDGPAALLDLLLQGNPQPLSDDDLHGEAMGQLEAHANVRDRMKQDANPEPRAEPDEWEIVYGNGIKTPQNSSSADSSHGGPSVLPDNPGVRGALQPGGGESPAGGSEGGGNQVHDNRAPALKHRPGRPDRHSAESEGGHWITIGGHKDGKGKRKGGSPVYIENGTITKGAPSLHGRKIDALKEPGEAIGSHRQQVNASKKRDRAVWGKKAKAEGVKPEHLHQLAAEMIAHDKEFVADKTKMLHDARKMMGEYGGHAKTLHLTAAKGGDASKIPGFDQVAETISRQFPHLFGGDEREHKTDRLYELLTAGNPEAMAEEDAYEQALEQIKSHGGGSSEVSDEPIPFRMAGRPSRYGQGQLFGGDDGGHWVTIDGNHVLLDGAGTVKHPPEHAGKHVSEIASGPPRVVKKAKQDHAGELAATVAGGDVKGAQARLKGMDPAEAAKAVKGLPPETMKRLHEPEEPEQKPGANLFGEVEKPKMEGLFPAAAKPDVKDASGRGNNSLKDLAAVANRGEGWDMPQLMRGYDSAFYVTHLATGNRVESDPLTEQYVVKDKAGKKVAGPFAEADEAAAHASSSPAATAATPPEPTKEKPKAKPRKPKATAAPAAAPAAPVGPRMSSIADAHIREKSVGIQFDELFKQLKAESPGLTPDAFKDEVKKLVDAKQFKLGGWARMLDDLPDPSLAIQRGEESGVGYYLQPTAARMNSGEYSK